MVMRQLYSDTDMLACHLILIDGSCLLYRAGLNTNRFLRILKSLCDGDCGIGSTHLIVVFDYPSKSFRAKLYPDYKAHRSPKSADFAVFINDVKAKLADNGITVVELEGFEADDILASYATRASASGHTCRIVSSDKDMMQMVGQRVDIYDPSKKIIINEKGVFEKFGVTPNRVADVQSLCGDAVDNIPGVPGIGMSIAQSLIGSFGSLENILINPGHVPATRHHSIVRQHSEQAMMSKRLATLACDITGLPCWKESTIVSVSEPAEQKLSRPQQLIGEAPISQTKLYAWHSNALLGILGDDFDVNHPEDPQCGWFKRKLVKNGPWVPARIWIYQKIEDGCLVGDSQFQCEVNGKYADAEREWSWLNGNPITEAEYNYLVSACEWSRDYAPDEPMANPRQPVDWLMVPTPTF